MQREYYVYIMANQTNTVLYTGVTGNLWQRIEQHRTGQGCSFTSRYGINKLVYAEAFSRMNEAIMREKQIKAGSRKRKIALIENANPLWKDLGQ